MSLNELKSELDNIIFSDVATNEKVIYNHRIFLFTVKECIISCTGKSENEALELINKCKVLETPTSYLQVVFFTHETIYHWAMLAVYGDYYWQKGVQEFPLSKINEWLNNFLTEKKLPLYYSYTG